MIIISYLLCITITMILLSFSTSKNIKVSIIVCGLLFGVMSFFMIPRGMYYVDTVGYFSNLDQIRSILQLGGLDSAWQFIKYSTPYGAVPIMGLILLFCSLFPTNGTLLSITAFVDILFALLFFKDVVIDMKLSKKAFLISAAAFFCIFNFNAAIGGIRNDLVIIVGVFIIWKKINNQLSNIVAYTLLFLLSLIHPFTIILIMMLIIVDIFTDNSIIMKIFYIVFLSQKILQSVFIKLLTPFSNLLYVQSILSKSTQYLGDNASLTLSDMTFGRSLLKFIFIIFILVMFYILCKKRFPQKYNQIVLLFICFAVGAFSDKVLFGRIIKSIIILAIPYIGVLATTKFSKNSKGKKSIILLIMSITFIFCSLSLTDNVRALNKYYELQIFQQF